MKNRERVFIAAVGLLVSFVILFYILFNEMNLGDISLKIYSNQLMYKLDNKRYEDLYENFISSYGQTYNQFYQQQNNTNEILGNIKSYKFMEINNSKTSKLVSYEVKIMKYPGKNTVYIWNIIKQNRDWKVIGYTINTDIKTFTDINRKTKAFDLNIETSDRLNQENALKTANQIIDQYKQGQHQDIYLNGNEAIKKLGNINQFITYLSSAKARYGEVNSFRLRTQETSQDKLEACFTYNLNCEKEAELDLKVWVRMEDGFYLSGLKFVEDSW